jgi:Flp pilus assembly protein TadG
MDIRDEKGGSAVEFAVIAPLLFLILFGIIEFGILLYDKAMITNASREGARAGIVYSSPNRISNADIQNVVNNYLKTYLISLGSASTYSVSISPNDRSGSAAGDPLSVTVNYQFRFLVISNLAAWFGGGFGNSVNLSGTTVMRFE